MPVKSNGLKVTAIIFVIAAVVVVYVDSQNPCTTPRGKPGACIDAVTCEFPVIAPNEVQQFMKNSQCERGFSKICCESNVFAARKSLTTHGTPTIVASVPKSDADVQAGMAIIQEFECKKIDTAYAAGLSQYPWLALLVYTDGLDRTLDCGGSLITERYVLTSAYCIAFRNKTLVSVRLGEHDIGETSDCNFHKCAPPTQEIDVEHTVYHQNYRPGQFSDDIGLIRLVSQATFDSNVQPICLPINPELQKNTRNEMIVAGWGRTETGPRENILKTIVITTNDFQNETASCIVDAGGPIFSKERFKTKFVQFGIVSSGSFVCGFSSQRTYLKVTPYISWIAGNLRD